MGLEAAQFSEQSSIMLTNRTPSTLSQGSGISATLPVPEHGSIKGERLPTKLASIVFLLGMDNHVVF